jgi:hypothetical protein
MGCASVPRRSRLRIHKREKPNQLVRPSSAMSRAGGRGRIGNEGTTPCTYPCTRRHDAERGRAVAAGAGPVAASVRWAIVTLVGRAVTGAVLRHTSSTVVIHAPSTAVCGLGDRPDERQCSDPMNKPVLRFMRSSPVIPFSVHQSPRGINGNEHGAPRESGASAVCPNRYTLGKLSSAPARQWWGFFGPEHLFFTAAIRSR